MGRQMGNILEVKDLCKTYVIDKRQNNVLRNVSFNVEEGDMVAIMGPSGSGKSTLLYSVSGMDLATSGSVLFDGQDIMKLDKNALAKKRLDEMGFIFQQMYMMKNLTILDNILLPAVESKKSRDSRAEKVSRALFADEPTGALNRASSTEVMNELVRLNDEGTTIMMVTHDAKVASRCKRVFYILDGTIKGEYIAPVDESLSDMDRERRLNNWLLDFGW